ncbi:hypothetical protein BDN70DRAFT_901127 [Pholiota conissans]|uniref:Uncharacterized protein n=1 Tax=Pholiota conissans TaxID=109636 RepID=A0A9P5YKV4_9AGAR|nr:hypothetical protein BDN70DRAFT_901127 [Pholiota conissans]
MSEQATPVYGDHAAEFASAVAEQKAADNRLTAFLAQKRNTRHPTAIEIKLRHELEQANARVNSLQSRAGDVNYPAPAVPSSSGFESFGLKKEAIKHLIPLDGNNMSPTNPFDVDEMLGAPPEPNPTSAMHGDINSALLGQARIDMSVTHTTDTPASSVQSAGDGMNGMQFDDGLMGTSLPSINETPGALNTFMHETLQPQHANALNDYQHHNQSGSGADSSQSNTLGSGSPDMTDPNSVNLIYRSRLIPVPMLRQAPATQTSTSTSFPTSNLSNGPIGH